MKPNSPTTLVFRLEKIPAAVLLMLAIASLQMGGALAVGLFKQLGPLGTVSLRVSIAAVILLLAERPRLDAPIRANWVPLVLFGLSIAGMNVCIYESFSRIPFGVAVTLELVGPLSTAALFSRRGRDFVWVVLAGFGVLLLTPLTGASPDPIGVWYALAAGAFWAAYAQLGALVGSRLPGRFGLTIGISVAACVMLPLGIWSAGATLMRPFVLAVGFLIALASTVIPFSLEFEALRRLPARTYGIFVSLDPAAAAVTGAVLLHQPLTLRTLAAIVCVVIAAVGVTLTAQKDRQTP